MHYLARILGYHEEDDWLPVSETCPENAAAKFAEECHKDDHELYDDAETGEVSIVVVIKPYDPEDGEETLWRVEISYSPNYRATQQ